VGVRRLSVAAVLIAATACGGDPGNGAVSRVWPAMGTMMSVAAWGADTTRLQRVLDRVRDVLDSLGDGSLRGTLRLAPGIAVDSSKIAEGYALDRAALALAGVADSALLDLGGQFFWVAARPTRRMVGIAEPEDPLRSLAAVELQAGSVGTVSEGKRSVTVLASTGVAADAWATAFFGLGCDSVLALAPRLTAPRPSVVCADSAGVRWTPDLGGRVLLPTAPGRPGRAP
jgi:hypothetical protein